MNEEALRAELEKHHAEGYAWALSCCARDPGVAEDVLQQVYLKVLDGRAQFRGQASFKTWLLGLIRNTAVDEWRRRRRHQAKLIEYEHTAGTIAGVEPPDEAVEKSQIQDDLLEALAALPMRQQEVVRLVFYHDLSLAEAAAVMGVSIGTARTHYERSKERLRQWLETTNVFL